MHCKNSEFEGKVAIVTGAGKGLGRAIALELGRLMANVVCVARTPTYLDSVVGDIRRSEGRAIAIPCDVSATDAVESMNRQVMEHCGHVDMLVNCAAIQGKIDWIVNYDAAEWDRIMAANLRSVFLCCKAVLPDMIARRTGKIVNIAAGVMDERIDWGVAAYYASKAGVVNFTRQLAGEVKRHNVFVNAVDPAGMDTGMSDEVLFAETPDSDFSKTQTNLHNGPRLRKPEAIVPLVIFLLSESSNMMTGRLLQASAPDDVHYLQL